MQRVGLIAQNTPMPNIFDYISSGTCVWAQTDCIELLDGSILSFTALPDELCADAATFFSFVCAAAEYNFGL